MKNLIKLDFAWAILMIVTLLNALVAETLDQSYLVTTVICFSIVLKGRLVMDRFMELNKANDTIRNLVRSYFYFFPMLVLLSDIFSEQLASITSLS